MNKIPLCLLACLLVFGIIQVAYCTIESEVLEELPINFPLPEDLPEGIPELIKAEFTTPPRNPDRIYPCNC